MEGAGWAGFSLRTAAPAGTLRIAGSRYHGSARLAAWLANRGQPNVFTPAGSSLKFCRLAAGGGDMYPCFGPTSQWDTAAAQCVLEQAGGAVLDLQGRRLGYEPERPLLNPEFIAAARPDSLDPAVMDALRAASEHGVTHES